MTNKSLFHELNSYVTYYVSVFICVHQWLKKIYDALADATTGFAGGSIEMPCSNPA